MSQEKVRGVATGDPLAGNKNIAIGSRPTGFALQEIASENHGFTSIASFKGSLLTVGFRSFGEHHTLGSAVLLHPGVAVTAKHVVADWLAAIASGEAAAVCQAPTDGALLLWDVVAVHTLSNADIALLMLRYRTDLPPGDVFVVGRASTRMPVAGDRVFLAGFTAQELTVPIAPQTDIRGDMRVSVGTVIDVWPDGRDSVMLPSASFAVDCPSLGGMSGGPVFDSGGRMIGLVCSGTDGVEVACVSHVWPALIASIQPVWPLSVGQTSLLHMGQRQGVDIYRPDAFQFRVLDGAPMLAYQPWS